MSSSASNSAPSVGPRHSVFLSYASADRAAARALRDSLAAAGLDVWLDEEELAGGEAWDAKIRQQIRTCTYFMPVISATTEARREGYFRREWRLAVERTLDFADDVLFLLPVVVDDTRDQGARVPEKFSTVQWLRCPGGRETPALRALAQRLADDGAESAPTVTAAVEPTPAKISRRERRRAEATPRPFPTFPAFPSPGKRLHFLYELLLWSGHTVVALWLRLPRWLRAVATVVIVFKVIAFVFDRSHIDTDGRSWEKIGRTEIPKAVPPPPPNASALKERIINAAGAALDTLQLERPLAIVTFTAADPSLMDAALSAFASMHSSLKDNGRGEQVAVSLAPLSIDATDASALARATTLKSHWLLTGVVRAGDPAGFKLEVKLYDASTGQVIWQDTRTGTTETAEAVGSALAADVLTHVTLTAPKAE